MAQAHAIVPPNTPLYLTGHSLGGGLASLLASKQNEPFPVVTFNAPGMLRSFINSKKNFISGYISWQKMDKSKFLHIRTQGDIVSIGTGPTIGKKRTIHLNTSQETLSFKDRVLDSLIPVRGIIRSVQKSKDYILFLVGRIYFHFFNWNHFISQSSASSECGRDAKYLSIHNV